MAEQFFQTKNGSEGIEIVNLIYNKIPISRNKTLINFSRDYDNKSDNWIEENIMLIWEEKCKQNSRLYNKSKFRWAGVAASHHEDYTVVINLGLTTYKDLMGTNCHPFGKELIPYGIKTFQNGRACLADVLGIGALLLTTDKKFVFLKRALWTGEDQGKLDRPGGHPEPDNVSNTMKTWTEEECSLAENSIRIRDEIFDSVLHEIRDEVNLPIDSLQDPLLMGVGRSLERLGRPSAEFLVLCSLTSKEVEALYSQNSQAEADESLGIVFIPEENIRLQNLEPSIWQNLTDAACGAIELYSQCY